MRLKRFQNLLVVVLGAISGANAQTVSSQGIGFLPNGSLSSAWSVSADGSALAGWGTSSGRYEGYRWTPQTGLVSVGHLPGPGFTTEAFAISGDGLVVGGLSVGTKGPEAFRWTADTGIVGLGDLPGGDYWSAVQGASFDGSVLVGTSRSGAAHFLEAFRWTEADGMVPLGDLPGGNYFSQGLGISADGQVIVGYSQTATMDVAFRWTPNEGMVALGDISSHALAVSGDGRTIVGWYHEPTSGVPQAFRWTEAEGFVGLGSLPGAFGMSKAYGVSGDGSVIVGDARVQGGNQAIIWTAQQGMRSVLEVLRDDFGLGQQLEGWRLYNALAVSADGLTIVGNGFNPDGRSEGWIARLPEPGTVGLLGLVGPLLVRRSARRGPPFASHGAAGRPLGRSRSTT